MEILILIISMKIKMDILILLHLFIQVILQKLVVVMFMVDFMKIGFGHINGPCITVHFEVKMDVVHVSVHIKYPLDYGVYLDQRLDVLVLYHMKWHIF